MNLTKVYSTIINTLNQRVVKVLRFGKSDVQTSLECSSYGIDSNPIANMIAVYSSTTDLGDNVIVGYINKNQLAAVGEFRTYSTDSNGSQKFYMWLKNDGTCEIGGNVNYAVKFNELKTEFNKLQNNFNNHLIEYDAHTHLGVTSGSDITGITTPSTNTNSSVIDNAKNTKIKTI